MYNLLVSPQERSFVKREEDDLMALAIKVKEKKIKDVNSAIKKHVTEYQWVPFDYGMYLWDEKYFKKVLSGMLKNKELDKKIAISKGYFKNLSLEQTRLEKQLRIDKKHKQYFAAMRQAGYLLDYKKEIYTQIHFYAEKILRETGKRLGVKRELVQYYLPQEIDLALRTGKIVDKKILEARQKHCYVRWFDNDIEAIIENPDELMDKYLLKEEKVTGKFDGIIASAGRYTGKVKVLHSANEIDKVKQGDILVASMTSPDYVPAMRRAGAIITDEGGVMCHAAIVSRELGIPCVVGTKSATKILKDGDEVEVNANHNSVKIIRK
jgi:phosphoenolpyruvate synthase/pyruvate phosphate dikinase